MLLKLSFVAALAAIFVAGVHCQDDLDLDALINNVFNLTENKNTVSTPSPVEPVTGASRPAPVPVATTPAPTPPLADNCSGQCVPYYLCTEEDEVNTDGAGIIDIRVSEDQECVSYLETCCAKGNIKQVETTTKPSTAVEEFEGCGRRNSDGIGFRITGGKDNEAEYGEFPWMVAVLKEDRVIDNTINVYECGGSLIHPKVVLTGAHCVYGKDKNALVIRAGEWDTQTKNEKYEHQDRKVADVIIHEEYNKATLYNDIALLILESPVELAENVQPVCLPPQDTNFDLKNCFASGWGKNIFGKQGAYQVILKKIGLPVVPYPKCQSALRTTRLGKGFKLHRSFLCAGGVAGKDTCRGDGGSPLVCPIPGAIEQYYQAGIVAWGIGCGENAIPGVYGNVALFKNWIDAKLKAYNIDAKYYTYKPL